MSFLGRARLRQSWGLLGDMLTILIFPGLPTAAWAGWLGTWFQDNALFFMVAVLAALFLVAGVKAEHALITEREPPRIDFDFEGRIAPDPGDDPTASSIVRVVNNGSNAVYKVEAEWADMAHLPWVVPWHDQMRDRRLAEGDSAQLIPFHINYGPPDYPHLVPTDDVGDKGHPKELRSDEPHDLVMVVYGERDGKQSARRYLFRVTRDGSLALTVPSGAPGR